MIVNRGTLLRGWLNVLQDAVIRRAGRHCARNPYCTARRCMVLENRLCKKLSEKDFAMPVSKVPEV